MSVDFVPTVEFLLIENPIKCPVVKFSDFSRSKIIWLEALPVSASFSDLV